MGQHQRIATNSSTLTPFIDEAAWLIVTRSLRLCLGSPQQQRRTPLAANNSIQQQQQQHSRCCARQSVGGSGGTHMAGERTGRRRVRGCFVHQRDCVADGRDAADLEKRRRLRCTEANARSAACHLPYVLRIGIIALVSVYSVGPFI
jgi:hypothetical protein